MAVAAAAGAVLVPAAWGSESGDASGPGGGRTEAGELVVGVSFLPRPLRAGGLMRWRVRVTNRADARILVFATAQRADVALRSTGHVRYRWGAGRLFAQITGERRLQPGEGATFVLTDRLPVRPGRYELVARVTADAAPIPARVEVVVQAR